MQKCIAIQANSLDRINVETDTSLLLALEAQKRLYQIYWYVPKDLSLVNGKIYAKAKKQFSLKIKKYFKILKDVNLDLSKMKYVLIRQNPPFNMDYITSHFIQKIQLKKLKF